MADGFRALETSSDFRVIESGEARITERAVYVDVVVTGVGNVTSSGVVIKNTVFSGSAIASMSITTTVQAHGVLNAVASLVGEVTGAKVFQGEVSLIGDSVFVPNTPLEMFAVSTMVALAGEVFHEDGTLYASGDASSVPHLILNVSTQCDGDSDFRITTQHTLSDGAASFTGVGTIDSATFFTNHENFHGAATMYIQDRLVLQGEYSLAATTFTRGTEGNDDRITEYGDIRLLENAGIANAAFSVISADSTLIKYSSTVFGKYIGVWKPAIVYVKHDNVWKFPIATHRHMNGNWKRIG